MKMSSLHFSVFAGVSLWSSLCFAEEPSVKQLKAARAAVAVDHVILVLEARVWRDAASTAAPDTLSAVIKLKTEGNKSIPPGLEVDRVWLIRDKEVWAPGEHRDERQSVEPGQPVTFIDSLVGNGPKWKPGAKVTCVMRIKLIDGSAGLVKVSGVVIGTSR